MRLLFLILALLIGYTPAMAESEIPSSTKDMIHLTVTATNVRLRAGAGTEFEVLGMASRDNVSARRYVADATPRMDSTGKPWFRLLAGVEQQTELAVFKLDQPCWIRGDFVKTRALREGEADRVDSTLFRILNVSLNGLYGVAYFSPKTDLPVCATEDDCYFAEGKPVTNTALPAGGEYLLWTQPFKEGTTGNVCISVWKKIGENRIQLAGAMPGDVFENFDFGTDQEAIKRWKNQQPAYLWQ